MLRGDALALNEAAIEGLLSILPTADELQVLWMRKALVLTISARY